MVICTCPNLLTGINSTEQFSARWRKTRRAIHDNLHIHHVQVYQARQEREAVAFISRLLVEPQEWVRHVRQYVPH